MRERPLPLAPLSELNIIKTHRHRSGINYMAEGVCEFPRPGDVIWKYMGREGHGP